MSVKRIDKDLLKKYDVQAPRYTSYPTVPYWSDSPTMNQWVESLHKTFEKGTPSWALYLHVPFCETLCTFCGCNTTITRDHSVENPYVQTLLKEFQTYCQTVPGFQSAPLKQIHFGGGSPTFLSAEQLGAIVAGIKAQVSGLDSGFEGSIEVDPRRMYREQLEVLFDHGFRRISLGVQDFDPEVQRIVNRIQPLDMTQAATKMAREIGYDSVNFDLIYGLPKQTPEKFHETALKTIDLRPDRIALYSFAMVPWIKPAQRLFRDEEVPQGDEKRALYEVAHAVLTDAGYVEIGMDHFALKTDALFQSHHTGNLHRNFMGYTDQKTDILLGLGVSSISESPDCFHQNEKVLPVYERKVQAGEIPTFRGHRLSAEDQKQRDLILKFMTQMKVDLPSDEVVQDVKSFLASLFEDGLVELKGRTLAITEQGRPFLRNACMAMDLRLRRAKPDNKVFSRAL